MLNILIECSNVSKENLKYAFYKRVIQSQWSEFSWWRTSIENHITR